jgi:hypothetical protein
MLPENIALLVALFFFIGWLSGYGFRYDQQDKFSAGWFIPSIFGGIGILVTVLINIFQ